MTDDTLDKRPRDRDLNIRAARTAGFRAIQVAPGEWALQAPDGRLYAPIMKHALIVKPAESEADAWNYAPAYCSDMNHAMALVAGVWVNITFGPYQKASCLLRDLYRMKQLAYELSDNPARAIVLAYLKWKEGQDST